MPAYLHLGDIKGEATEKDHKEWIMVESMTVNIVRSVPAGAKDQQRARGETTLGDIHVVRKMDKTTPKLAEACAIGKFIPEAKINLCATLNGKQEPIMQYVLKNVIVTSYSFHGVEHMNPPPSEEVSLSFTDIEWTYNIYDPKDGKKKGNVPAKYNPGSSTN